MQTTGVCCFIHGQLFGRTRTALSASRTKAIIMIVLLSTLFTNQRRTRTGPAGSINNTAFFTITSCNDHKVHTIREKESTLEVLSFFIASSLLQIQSG